MSVSLSLNKPLSSSSVVRKKKDVSFFVPPIISFCLIGTLQVEAFESGLKLASSRLCINRDFLPTLNALENRVLRGVKVSHTFLFFSLR